MIGKPDPVSAEEVFAWIIHRLRHALGKHHPIDRKLKTRSEFLALWGRRKIAAQLIITVGLIASLVFSKSYFPSVLAERVFLNAAGLILQSCFLMQVTPAFAAFYNHLRRQQLILPIPTKTLSRKLFNLHATAKRMAIFCLGWLAAIVIAAGVAWSEVMVHLIWQLAILFVISRFAIVVVGKAGYHGWLPTIVFWLFVAATPLCLLSMADPHAAMILQPIGWLLLRVPNGILAMGGSTLAALFVTVAIGLACSIHQPPLKGVRRVASAFRNLPDRDDLQLGNINYVHPRIAIADRGAEHWGTAATESLADELIQNKNRFDPSGNLPPGKWKWIYRVAVVTCLACLVVTVSVSYFEYRMGNSNAIRFAHYALFIHLPNIVATMACVPGLRSGLVTRQSLTLMATSGLPRDFFLAMGVLLPATFFTAFYQDRWPAAFQHAAIWLLVGVVMRFAWIPFTRLVPEFENLTFAWMACMIGWGMVLTLFVLANWWHYPRPEALLVVPAVAGVLLACVGWDRVLAFVWLRREYRRQPRKADILR